MKLLRSAVLHLKIIYSNLGDCFDDAQNKQQTDACLLQPERITHPSVLITTNTAGLIHNINCLSTDLELVLRELFGKQAALLHTCKTGGWYLQHDAGCQHVQQSRVQGAATTPDVPLMPLHISRIHP